LRGKRVRDVDGFPMIMLREGSSRVTS
jgi:hypothetical protein